jgi:hypothetical protein
MDQEHMGVVTGYLFQLIAKQVEDHRLVLWYDPERAYSEAAAAFDLPNTTVAGSGMQPGQQPPTRNTRLAIVARNALRSILGDETAAEIEKQVDAGKLSLADLNALADKGKDISTGVLSLIFGTSHPQVSTR